MKSHDIALHASLHESFDTSISLASRESPVLHSNKSFRRWTTLWQSEIL